VIITDDDTDENWQVRDLEGLMHRYRGQVRGLDAQMVEALEDTQ
jgi:hypothetical protein